MRIFYDEQLSKFQKDNLSVSPLMESDELIIGSITGIGSVQELAVYVDFRLNHS